MIAHCVNGIGNTLNSQAYTDFHSHKLYDLATSNNLFATILI